MQYDEATSRTLAEEAIAEANIAALAAASDERNSGHATPSATVGAIACVSSPSAFRALKVMCMTWLGDDVLTDVSGCLSSVSSVCECICRR